MSQSLATKYRPQTFEEVCSQKSTIKILKKQISLHNFANCYLFAGSTGCGKTTLARILANEINEYKGSPIEIDGASNNGVDAVRDIIDSAKERSVDSEYKIFIIDECHVITSAGWNAFLKCIEEPPQYTIFMFCTTNPEKVPETIGNRCQRYNISKVATEEIKQRLIFICENEFIESNQDITEECIDYISRISDGCVRQAIAYLEKVLAYCAGESNITIDDVLNCLGNFSYKAFFELTDSFIDGDEGKVINIIENFYNSGVDLKLFVEQYLDFVLDLTKYCIFKNAEGLKIPSSMVESLNYTTNIENNINYFNYLLDKVLNIKNAIKYDVNNRTTVEIMSINICRGV